MKNRIAANNAYNAGGGFYRCDGTVVANAIHLNAAQNTGGGLHNCDPRILNNIITSNSAGRGGGLQGCGVVVDVPCATKSTRKETLVRKKVIETLGSSEVLVGADVAASLGSRQDDALQLLGRTFSVTGILPQTGTVDDSRIFAHLHTVQELAGKGPVINAVEIVGCCDQISNLNNS